MKRPNGLKEDTVQYWIKKPEQVRACIKECRKGKYLTALEQWLYIQWRIKNPIENDVSEKVSFT